MTQEGRVLLVSCSLDAVYATSSLKQVQFNDIQSAGKVLVLTNTNGNTSLQQDKEFNVHCTKQNQNLLCFYYIRADMTKHRIILKSSSYTKAKWVLERIRCKKHVI